MPNRECYRSKSPAKVGRALRFFSLLDPVAQVTSLLSSASRSATPIARGAVARWISKGRDCRCALCQLPAIPGRPDTAKWR